MKRLILIPARSGSTRVKNKNIKMLGDRPLVGHIAAAAAEVEGSRVIVSTDSEEIASVARDFGAETPFLRDAEIAGALSPSLSVILHALKWLRDNEKYIPDLIAYCPPTNPFTSTGTIENMFNALESSEYYNSIVTMTEPKTHPFRIIRENDSGRLEVGCITIDGKCILDIERSQDWPEVWEGSPACRMTRSGHFLSILDSNNGEYTVSGRTYDENNCTGYKINGIEAFDIDNNNDWEIAEILMKNLMQGPGSGR